MQHATRWNRLSLALLLVLLVLLPPLAAQAATVSVSPGSGAAGRIVAFTASGFDLEGIGYNTGFYVDGAFAGRCPDDARANCTVPISIPAYSPGPHAITATNSHGEQAATTYTVARPQLSVGPACTGSGSDVTVGGRLFAVGPDAGIYVDGTLLANDNYTDANGSFSRAVTIPANTTEGEHLLTVSNSVGQSESKTLTITAACLVVGQVTELRGGGMERQFPDGSWAPLAVGDPIHQSDRLRTPAGGGGIVLLNDNTQFVLGQGSELRVDDFDYEPQTGQGRSFFSVLQGAFVYTSGLIGKHDDPENVQIDTPVGCLGIRGTALYLRIDPQTARADVDLIHGPISVTPSTTGLTTLQTDGDAIALESGALVAVPEPGFGPMVGAVVVASALARTVGRDRRARRRSARLCDRGARP